MSRLVSRDVGSFAIIPDALVFSCVSDRAVRLYAVFARYADDSGLSYPSRHTLAVRLSWSESTVDRAMRELVKFGLLKVTLRVRDSEGSVRPGRPSKGWEATSSLYQLVTSVPPELGGGVFSSDATSHHPGDATCIQERRPNDSQLNENHLTNTRDVGFAAFWALYPKKVGKGRAEKSWRAALRVATAEDIMLGLKRALPAFAKMEARFIPHPSTWLNDQRWEDEMAGAAPTIEPPEECVNCRLPFPGVCFQAKCPYMEAAADA